MNVALFTSCFLDQYYPDTAVSMYKLLERAGCRVAYDPTQTCCGRAAYNAGMTDKAKVLGARMISMYKDADFVVMGAAGCSSMIYKGISNLFTNSNLHNESRALQAKCYDISSFLVNVLEFENFGAELPARAVLMQTCYGKKHPQIKTEPLELLERVYGLELVRVPEATQCCGYGDSFSFNFPELGAAMGLKLLNAAAAAAEILIVTDPGCLWHLESLALKNNISIKCMHIADVLATGWLEPSSIDGL